LRHLLGDPGLLQRMLAVQGLSTPVVSQHVARLQQRMVDALDGTAFASAELLNPPGDGDHARFLAFRSPHAQRWCDELRASDCITDVRGDVIRLGFGIYQDEADVDRFAALAGRLSA